MSFKELQAFQKIIAQINTRTIKIKIKIENSMFAVRNLASCGIFNINNPNKLHWINQCTLLNI